jgi:hypothetical protein
MASAVVAVQELRKRLGDQRGDALASGPSGAPHPSGQPGRELHRENELVKSQRVVYEVAVLAST